MAKDPVVKRYNSYDATSVSDVIAMTAANIEDAYIMAGVKDYTARDCVDRAADKVLDAYFGEFDASKLTLDAKTT